MLQDREQKEFKVYDEESLQQLFFMSVLWIFDHGKITGNAIILHVSVLCLVVGLGKTMQFSFQVLPHNSLEKFGLGNLDQILG